MQANGEYQEQEVQDQGQVSEGSWMDTIKNNKFIVLGVVVLLALAIYWWYYGNPFAKLMSGSNSSSKMGSSGMDMGLGDYSYNVRRSNPLE